MLIAEYHGIKVTPVKDALDLISLSTHIDFSHFLCEIIFCAQVPVRTYGNASLPCML